MPFLSFESVACALAVTTHGPVKTTSAAPVPAGTGTKARSNRGLDVLVEAEEVGRIVLVLEGDQVLVVPAVGVAHQALPLFQEAGEVEVHAAAGEASQVRVAGPGPRYVGFVLLRLWLPVRLDAQQVRRAPVAEGALVRPQAAHGSALEPDVDGGVVRGRGFRLLYEGFDHPVAQLVHVQRLPVITPPIRVILVQELLDLNVRHRSAEVRDRVPELAQGPERLLALLHGACVHRQEPDELFAVPLLGEVLDPGDPAQEAQGTYLIGGPCYVPLSGAQHVSGTIAGVEHEGAHHLGAHGVESVL